MVFATESGKGKAKASGLRPTKCENDEKKKKDRMMLTFASRIVKQTWPVV